MELNTQTQKLHDGSQKPSVIRTSAMPLLKQQAHEISDVSFPKYRRSLATSAQAIEPINVSMKIYNPVCSNLLHKVLLQGYIGTLVVTAKPSRYDPASVQAHTSLPHVVQEIRQRGQEQQTFPRDKDAMQGF